MSIFNIRVVLGVTGVSPYMYIIVPIDYNLYVSIIIYYRFIKLL